MFRGADESLGVVRHCQQRGRKGRVIASEGENRGGRMSRTRVEAYAVLYSDLFFNFIFIST